MKQKLPSLAFGLLCAGAALSLPRTALAADPAGEPGYAGTMSGASPAAPQGSASRPTALSPEEARRVAEDPQVQQIVRAQVEAEEVARFQRAQRGVVTAYAILWALVVLFVVLLIHTQRRLHRHIVDLEDRLRRAEGKP